MGKLTLAAEIFSVVEARAEAKPRREGRVTFSIFQKPVWGGVHSVAWGIEAENNAVGVFKKRFTVF